MTDKKITGGNKMFKREELKKVLKEKKSPRYSYILKSWRENWGELATYFKYPQEIRTLIYTTNPIESLNRGIKKVTKTRAIFPNEDALFK